MLSVLAIVCVWVNDLPLGWRLGVTIPFGLWLLFEVLFFVFDLDGLEKVKDDEEDTIEVPKEIESVEYQDDKKLLVIHFKQEKPQIIPIEDLIKGLEKGGKQ